MLAVQFWALIVDCFREALDRKLFWVMAAISVAIAAGMACISFDEKGVDILFGAWHLDLDALSTSNPRRHGLIGSVLTQIIADIYIGWVGIIIALVATADVIPGMMRGGAVEVLVSKPLSRPMIFLGKYIGAMVFVTLQVSIFVVLTLMVIGSRWAYWMWPYLWCIPLTVLLFSYIYAFSALFGVITRSAMASLLLAMLAWLAIFIPQFVYESLMTAPAMGLEPPKTWVQVASAVKRVVPNTTEITYIAGKLVGAAGATEVAPMPTPAPTSQPSGPNMFAPDPAKLVEAERTISNVDFVRSVGSSLLFEAVIVIIAMWKFSRRDF